MAAKYTDDAQGHLRNATISYLIALLIIASLTIATHFIIDKLVEKQAMAASLISMSGRQRMLSQWIAKASLQLTVSTDQEQYDATKNEMQALVELMRASHEKLVGELQEFDAATPAGIALRQVYYGNPYRLDARVRNYLQLSQTILTTPPQQIKAQHAALRGIQDATKGPIIDALDEVVSRYQEINRNTIYALRQLLLTFMVVMLLTILAEALFIFRPLFRKLAITHQALLLAARTDPLTGCMNRRHFMETATREFERFRRYGTSVAVLMIDIDHFKTINDSYGHDIGDDAIRLVVQIISDMLRSTDLVGRMGGEEFAVILPETELDTAVIVADKLRYLIAETPIKAREGHWHPMTVSIGATIVTNSDTAIFETLKRADTALYDAKRSGRNRTVSTSPSTQEMVIS